MQKCKHCGVGYMKKKDGKFGEFYACTNFPRCANKETIKKEKSELEKQADEILNKLKEQL